MTPSDECAKQKRATRKPASKKGAVSSTESSSIDKLHFTQDKLTVAEQITNGEHVLRLSKDTAFILVWETLKEKIKTRLFECELADVEKLKAKASVMLEFQQEMVELHAVASALSEDIIEQEGRAQVRNAMFE